MTAQPLASPSVVVDAYRAEVRQAAQDMGIHHATCRPRRQGLACSLCYRTADRLDRAEARLEMAEHKAGRR